MSRFTTGFAAAAVLWCLLGAGAARADSCPALLDRSALRLQDEKPQNLCQYAGKVVLVVNTASYCGFTPQYKGLEALYKQYRSRGLVVLGFPTNDFGAQEPGSNKDIAAFCESTFGVQFPMFTKTTVKGANIDPLFAELSKRSGKAPGWNFHKYLIARDGSAVTSFSSLVEPQDRKLVAEIERLLDMR
jgi:glutathione peroxidase